MKWLLKQVAQVLLALAILVVGFKIFQKICWENKLTLIGPPSIESFDPLERVEAARQLAKIYGGKQ